ncbi:division/cell wall cluster transcriptional repressor MraZ [Streptobacillus canis]|uniref:division/cell wall cluster transcriptional repressor MraZ n=1 Tax=Streptobacillus canis TaxID=2678686 RepID=UPI0012E1720F|nr:division/cell wall cluster transcriptional repressor MraZ [Streptobacillus canis]
MFIGEYSCSVDTKGRLMLPAKFREMLNGENFFITKGVNGQIDLYNLENWKEVVEKLSKVKQTDEKATKFKRFIIGSAQEIELDSQGRLTVTSTLKKYAELSKKATVIGMGNKIEIWDSEKLDTYRDDEDINEIMGEIDIDF